MKNKNSIKGFIIGILIVLIVGFVLWAFLHQQPQYIQGEIEAKEIRVAPKIPGRIAEIYVNEGDYVTKGQPIALLETPEIDAKLTQAKALAEVAKAQLDKAEKGTRTEKIQVAYNQWQQAKVASDLAEKTYERINNLYKDLVLPEQKRDEAYAKSIAMKQQAESAKSMYEMAKKGARKEDKKMALALVNQAQGATSEVESYKNEATITAPDEGEIGSIIPETGEIVNAGYPVVKMVDLNKVWGVFHIREDRMMKFQKDADFQVIVPALGGKKITVKVMHIAVLGDFATWTATKAKGDFDKKTFEIKVYPTETVEGLRPGMSILLDESLVK